LRVRFEERPRRRDRRRRERGCAAVKTALDDGAALLGEVALVDGQGRIGPLGTVFYDTLLDENAASHIALGHGFPFAVGEEDLEQVNERSGSTSTS
jgi:leucyl aminopeptidase (aminopeptidase T)